MSRCAWMECVGWIICVVAVSGVVLNNRKNPLCFRVWIVSNGLSAALHAASGMWALTARDIVFLALCLHGMAAWEAAADASTISDELTGCGRGIEAQCDRSSGGTEERTTPKP